MKFVLSTTKGQKEEHFFIGSFWFLTPVFTGVILSKNMKAIYTILFFLNTLSLYLLTYATVQFLDEGVNYLKVIFMGIAIVICSFILVYLLLQYIKISSSGRKEL